MFKNGVMVTGNAVSTEPGVSFTIADVQHASPHMFKGVDLEHIGSGVGAQALGEIIAQSYYLPSKEKAVMQES